MATGKAACMMLTKAAVARVLGVGTWNVDELVRRGALKTARSYPGVRAKFRLEDVLALKSKYERGDGTPCPAA